PRTRRAFVIVDWMQTKADCDDETLSIKPSWFHLLPQSGHLRALTKTRGVTPVGTARQLVRRSALPGISSAALRSSSYLHPSWTGKEIDDRDIHSAYRQPGHAMANRGPMGHHTHTLWLACQEGFSRR